MMMKAKKRKRPEKEDRKQLTPFSNLFPFLSLSLSLSLSFSFYPPLHHPGRLFPPFIIFSSSLSLLLLACLPACLQVSGGCCRILSKLLESCGKCSGAATWFHPISFNKTADNRSCYKSRRCRSYHIYSCGNSTNKVLFSEFPSTQRFDVKMKHRNCRASTLAAGDVHPFIHQISFRIWK